MPRVRPSLHSSRRQAHDWPAHATRLAATVARYLEIGGHYPEALAIYGHAGLAARDSETDQARRHWRRALVLFTRLGTPEAGEVRTRLIGLSASPEPRPAAGLGHGDGGRHGHV